MSILIANVAGTCLTRTSDVLDCASAFTMMAWIYMPSGRTWATNFLALWPSEYHYYFCNIRRDGGNLKLRLRSPSTGNDDVTVNTDISTDTWYHVAVTRSSNTFTMYVNGASIGETTYTDSLSTYTMAIGEPDGTGTQDYVQDAKYWSRALSLAEINAEMRSRRPVTWNSLYAWYPLLGDSARYLKDYSGQGRDWTATNAPDMKEIGPAIGWGPTGALLWPPAVTATGTTVTPGIASLELTGYAPTVTVTANVVCTPGAASLTATAYAPVLDLKVTPGVASIAVTAFVPTVSTPVVCTPGVALLSVTPYAPTVIAPAVVVPGMASLALTPYEPTVTAGASVVCVPGVASLTITPLVPVIGTALIVGVGVLTLTAYEPTVNAGVTAIPGVASLTLTLYAPTVSSSVPVAVVTAGAWSSPVVFAVGDEWIVTIDGPSADAVKLRATLAFKF